MPNLSLSGSGLWLHNPRLNSLFSEQMPQGIAAADFCIEKGILCLV